jgi:hypothetical protein
MGLPEEVVDHIYDLTGVDIDQRNIVVVPNPLVRSVSWREPVAVRIIDEKPRLEEQAVEVKAQLQAAVPMGAIGRVIRPRAIDEAVVTPVIAPVVAAVTAPAVIPAAEITPVPAIAATVVPAPIVAAPVAPVTAEVVTASVIAIGAARIAGNIANLIAKAATRAVAPLAPTITAILDPIAADITTAFDPVCPAVTTIFHAVGTDIAATLDTACLDFAATVDPISGAITATPIKLIAADIAATLYPVGADFTAPVDLFGPRFAAAVNAVGTHFAPTVGLLRALCSRCTCGHFTAKSARWCRAARRSLRRRGLPRLRSLPLDPCFGTPPTAFSANLLTFGAGFSAGLTAIAATVLRFDSRGRKSESERSGQSRERTASSKKMHHYQCLQDSRPTTSGLLRSPNYAAQTVAGMNRLIDVHKKCEKNERSDEQVRHGLTGAGLQPKASDHV